MARDIRARDIIETQLRNRQETNKKSWEEKKKTDATCQPTLSLFYFLFLVNRKRKSKMVMTTSKKGREIKLNLDWFSFFFKFLVATWYNYSKKRRNELGEKKLTVKRVRTGIVNKTGPAWWKLTNVLIRAARGCLILTAYSYITSIHVDDEFDKLFSIFSQ
jgi:hypothetical protein